MDQDAAEPTGGPELRLRLLPSATLLRVNLSDCLGEDGEVGPSAAGRGRHSLLLLFRVILVPTAATPAGVVEARGGGDRGESGPGRRRRENRCAEAERRGPPRPRGAPGQLGDGGEDMASPGSPLR